MKIIYNLFIALYRLGVIVISPFNRKARLWHRGRKEFFGRWKIFNRAGRKLIWFHCASLGEFEQGRPVIEEIKKRDGNLFVLLTFFSPSGYEIRKDYPLADAVCYLPADTPENARKFINLFKPDMAVFVKYEFWYNYIATLRKNNIPLYLISAIFRQEQVFFRWYGKWFRAILNMFDHIFVQDESSLALLNSASVTNATVAGDTRFDRVYALAEEKREIAPAAAFSQGRVTIVAGSTWPADHDILVRFMNETEHDVTMILAPHEINDDEIDSLSGRFNSKGIRFSRYIPGDDAGGQVLLIDNIGMLSSLYAYGKIAYIGGGFGKGIHNTLEACTHGLPVIFGPNYQKFREARELAGLGGAFPINNLHEFIKTIDQLMVEENLIRSGQIAREYVKSGTGATAIIADKIMKTLT